MSKVAKRLLVFFIGVPLVLFLVMCNFMNHLPIQVAICTFCLLGANEFCVMLKNKGYPIFNKAFIMIASFLLPFSSYILILFGKSIELIFWLYLFIIFMIMTFECFSTKTFEKSVQKIAFSSFVIFYVGYLITFINRLTYIDNSLYILALFFILIFMCDSGAWFFGVLFGKGSRGFVACSPNKSLIGFAGGIVTSIASGILFKYLFGDILPGSYFRVVILAFITAFSGIIGDLIESVIKRSLDCKDSGNLIPGRGGILDSIDSLLVGAPIYYICLYFLYLA